MESEVRAVKKEPGELYEVLVDMIFAELQEALLRAEAKYEVAHKKTTPIAAVKLLAAQEGLERALKITNHYIAIGLLRGKDKIAPYLNEQLERQGLSWKDIELQSKDLIQFYEDTKLTEWG